MMLNGSKFFIGMEEDLEDMFNRVSLSDREDKEEEVFMDAGWLMILGIEKNVDVEELDVGNDSCFSGNGVWMFDPS
ncbi:hypothetical protein PTKIN_Ptkin08bG0090000 [Pterospermum kingtungense]